jgi:ribonuclease M5
MNFYDGIIVVEGRGDEAFLSSFIDSIYVVTNGFELNKKDIDFLKSIKDKNKIIVLTDSDDAGLKIRQRIGEEIPGCVNIVADINECNKNGKHGIAESNKNHILSLFKGKLTLVKDEKPCVISSDLYSLGLNNKNKRNELCEKFRLGNCNFKTMIKRINYKQIDLKQIMECIDGDK